MNARGRLESATENTLALSRSQLRVKAEGPA